MLRALAEHSSRRRNSAASLRVFFDSLLSAKATSMPLSASTSASAPATTATATRPVAARSSPPLPSFASGATVPRRSLSTKAAAAASAPPARNRREPHLSLRADVARVVVVPSPSTSRTYRRPPAVSAGALPTEGLEREGADAEERAPPLLLSPETPLAEALLTVSSSTSSRPSLSASDEFAIDRLRSRGVETAGELFELFRGELSSSSRSRARRNGSDEERREAAATAVASSARLPPSVVAAVCAGVEAAARGQKVGGSSPVTSMSNEVVAEIPRTRKRRSAPTTTTRKDDAKKGEQRQNQNNVLEFRQTASPTLTGCAAASASRVLRAPPTDPRWSTALTSGTLFPSGEQPPLVDDDVRAVLTRRAPQADRYFHGDPYEVKVTSRGKKSAGGRPGSRPSGDGPSSKDSYGLHPRDTPPALRGELEDFYRFWTVRFPGQQQQPVAAVTAEKYVDHLRRMLGWAIAEGKVKRDGGGDGASSVSLPPTDLSLRDLVPSPGREGAKLAMEYAAWLARHRGVTPHTEGLAVRSLLSAAKFLYHDVSESRVASGERPYSDLDVVTELRAMSREAREAGKRAPSVSDESAKWLDWPDYLAVVEELRKECGALNERGRRRTDAAVAWSLQRYLMFAILACVPDRQRTLRELEVGRTLFYESGKWVIRHGAGDYKTGRVYGTRPPLQLDESLYPELHAYLSTWRACLNPKHDFVFTKKTGEPMTMQAVHKLFNMAAFRLSGKKLNPHLVRGMVITHLRRRGDATEAELESLAFLMGHSLAMQRSTYDKRSAADKVEPAVGLLQRLNNSDDASGGGRGP